MGVALFMEKKSEATNYDLKHKPKKVLFIIFIQINSMRDTVLVYRIVYQVIINIITSGVMKM